MSKQYSISLACSKFLTALIISLGLPSTVIAAPNSTSIIYIANTQGLEIGAVKREFQYGGLCTITLPNTQKMMMVIPFQEKSNSVVAWVNINGQDVRLRRVSLNVISKTHSISKYQAKNISVTLDSKTTKVDNTNMYSEESIDKVSVQYQGKTKTINTTGNCTI
jgi:hypothetical protein